MRLILLLFLSITTFISVLADEEFYAAEATFSLKANAGTYLVKIHLKRVSVQGTLKWKM